MAKKKLTPTQQAYNKERKRIENYIKRNEEKGYIFPENALPDVPKRITKASVKRLQKITAEALRKKARTIDVSTGEILTGKKARDYVKSHPQVFQPKQTITPPPTDTYEVFPVGADIIISNFKVDVIEKFPNNAGPIITRWLNSLLQNYEKEDVAKMLQDAGENGVVVDYTVAYDNDRLFGRLAEFLDYLPDASEGFRQEIIEALEFEEDWDEPV